MVPASGRSPRRSGSAPVTALTLLRADCSLGLGALGLPHSACHYFGCIARHGIPGKPKAAALWHSWLKRWQCSGITT